MAHPVRLVTSAAGVILAGASFGLSHSHGGAAACAGGQGSIAASPQAGRSPGSFATEFGAGATANGAAGAWGARPVVVVNGATSGGGSTLAGGSSLGGSPAPAGGSAPADGSAGLAAPLAGTSGDGASGTATTTGDANATGDATSTGTATGTVTGDAT